MAGCVLFVLFVVGIFFSTTLPLGKVLFSPHPRHFNVALFMIALTVGSLLPAVLGYVIGDYSTKAKERIVHHFNGVLFGLLALWLMLILSTLLWLIPEIPAIPPNTLLVITFTILRHCCPYCCTLLSHTFEVVKQNTISYNTNHSALHSSHQLLCFLLLSSSTLHLSVQAYSYLYYLPLSSVAYPMQHCIGAS